MPDGSSHVSDVHAENSFQGHFFILFPWRPYWFLLPTEKDFIELLGKGMLLKLKLLRDQIPEERAANWAKPDTQRGGVKGGGGGSIPIYIPLNWFNVNETQSRLKNSILICTVVLLPLPEMFRRVTRLYRGVKMEVGLDNPGQTSEWIFTRTGWNQAREFGLCL